MSDGGPRHGRHLLLLPGSSRPSWKHRKIPPERESHPGRRIHGAEPLGGHHDVTLKLGIKNHPVRI